MIQTNIKQQQFNSNIQNLSQQNTGANSTPNFRGKDWVLKGIQQCEKKPMVNIAVIDLITAILPRSIWESLTNIFAGFEALRRESSGLIVNCLIPGFITLGAAHLFNKGIMGKGKANMSNCWASSDSIHKVTNHYKDAHNTDAFKEGMGIYNNETHARVYATHYNMVEEASGFDGFDKKNFKDILTKEDKVKVSKDLTESLFKKDAAGKLTENLVEKTPKKTLKDVFGFITGKTHIAQDLTFSGGKADKRPLSSNLDKALNDTHHLLKGMIKENIKPEEVGNFAKRAGKLLKTKSILGMLIILPLAASMQHINRKITEKTSGVKGAPIHDDYGKKSNQLNKTPEQIKKEKQQLIAHKIWAVGSMVGVGLLSMMKLPTMKTLKDIVQFKGQFPTMDQARAISVVTFGSRMAVADDKEELAEAHTRDLVTFSSMYFLGDYAAKGAASYYEKKHGISLLNKTYDPAKNKNLLVKAKNWVLNTHLKSSDELKGVGEAFEKARSLRAKCQVANIGLSLAILGVIVPVFTRLRTRKSDAAKRAQSQGSPTMNVQSGTQKTKTTVSSFKSKASNPTFTRFKAITDINKENK